MAEDEENCSYLEKKLDVKITYETNQIEFTFQRAKVKMSDELEIELLKTINPEISKELTLTEDKVIITYHIPQSYANFDDIYKNNIRSRWQFAYNIIQTIRSHKLERAKLCVSPENIVFDQGLVPYFLHYGVSESLPPYETGEEQLWLETKAVIATIVDNKYDFTIYYSHYETKDLPDILTNIMRAETYDEIIKIIEDNIKKDDAYEETVVHIPERKWKVRRYIIWALTILLIPLLIYGSFALFFKIPETNSYVESNRYFHEEEYSSVIDTLQKYKHKKMPRITQYELASSYIVNESLTEEQRKNVNNTITLQSDRNYFLYWIDIGRGDYQEAIDTARVLEDRDLIIYGLLKLRESVKTDQDLSGEEREEELKQIQQEIDEYEQEMNDEQKEAEEKEAEEKESEMSEEEIKEEKVKTDKED